MQPISIDRFAKMTVKNNPDENLADLKRRLKDVVAWKNASVHCWQCGQPIWVIDSFPASWG